MFDERSLNLIANPTIFDRGDYERTLKILNALISLIEASVERFQYEWDKLAHVEIGDDTYVLKPNESGGYSWEKIDYFDHDWYEDELELEITQETVNSSATTEQHKSQSAPANNTTAQSDKAETLNQEPTSNNVQSQSHQELFTNAQIPVTRSEELAPTNTQPLSPLENSTILIEQQAREQEALSKEDGAISPFLFVEACNHKHIDPSHWKELVEDSAIAPEIAARNFKSLHQHGWQHQAWEYLMYSPTIDRLNTGRLTDSDLKRYSHIEKGGWWCDAGVDPRSFANLESGQQPLQKLWGCYKPNEPRFQPAHKHKSSWAWQAKPNTLGKVDKPASLKKIKYEHPPKTELSIFLLEVPDEIANKVYSKAGVNPSASDRQSGFWYCVWKHNIPITVTEGAKKTAAILSQGDAAIGLPGINAGYRSCDRLKNPITPHLREEFAVFATPGRDIKICFDYETKAKTKRSVFGVKVAKLSPAATRRL
ncbi:DUF3854 domain-containing protein [Nostoc sp. ChiQUE01b]|uniref:DUF3854 domain-containing protein n=1 Tax=Nostoc sp. ChiQUE01b TaxID=3075376 RepID=UPI002AD20B61|nr:DUF3854 domain-containing protein [Nostoc sp. ChiQUE01b]MDZ8264112.1 DUF3854 domain-containing protein [Nostoc sp. ChiQUE01b]